ncbi:hypothetical protein Pmi06nite_78000 [Planotetraspora mira]|uniref:Tyr recombinase domain-containing protein n=1 Tax=Planotetraspora mira TaxID=58121 RepID=A0A8J3TWE8_9ACTN|nr:hypothetical protein Pmi06nite_78000 [Planotetraspora mira]
MKFAPRDSRRPFATELVNNGLPIHIGAALLGHLDIRTTRGYVAVFEEDVITRYQQFLAQRRSMCPVEEYREPTAEEWSDFRDHFDKRRVELGSCGRPTGRPAPTNSPASAARCSASTEDAAPPRRTGGGSRRPPQTRS